MRWPKWNEWKTSTDPIVKRNAPKEFAIAGIAPYLKLTVNNIGILRCPSDPVPAGETRVHVDGKTYNYPLSYGVNWFFGATPRGGTAHKPKITMVRNSAEKVMVIEEDERTINDGLCAIFQPDPGNVKFVDRLALRHDGVYRKKREVAWGDGSITGILNSRGKGIIGFCDGHAEFTTRAVAHSRYRTTGNPQTDLPLWTGGKDVTMLP